MGSVRSDQKAAPLAVTFRCAGGAKAHVGAEAIRRGRVAGKSVLVPVVNVIDVWWVGVVGLVFGGGQPPATKACVLLGAQLPILFDWLSPVARVHHHPHSLLDSMATAQQLQDALRDFIKNRAGPKKMIILFKTLDIDGDGKITRKELRTSLASIGHELSEEDTATLFKSLDTDKDGRVVYEEVHKFMMKKACEVTKTEARKSKDKSPPMARITGSKEGPRMRNEVRDFFKERYSRVSDLFNDLDISDDAKISKSELRRSLAKVGFDVPTNEMMTELFSKCDTDNSGRIDYQELYKWVLSKNEKVEPLAAPPPPPIPFFERLWVRITLSILVIGGAIAAYVMQPPPPPSPPSAPPSPPPSPHPAPPGGSYSIPTLEASLTFATSPQFIDAAAQAEICAALVAKLAGAITCEVAAVVAASAKVTFVLTFLTSDDGKVAADTFNSADDHTIETSWLASRYPIVRSPSPPPISAHTATAIPRAPRPERTVTLVQTLAHAPSPPPPSPPPVPPPPSSPPAAPPIDPIELSPAQIGLIAVVLIGTVCALIPVPPPKEPKALPDVPGDDYEWRSKSGARMLQVRYPKSKGKPPGDWFLKDPADGHASGTALEPEEGRKRAGTMVPAPAPLPPPSPNALLSA